MKLLRRRNVVILGVILLLYLVGVPIFFPASDGDDRPTLELSDVIADAKEGLVAGIEVDGDSLTVTMTDGREFESRKEEGTSIAVVLADNDVEVGGADGVAVEVIGSIAYDWPVVLLYLLPFPVLVAIAFFAYRRAVVVAARREAEKERDRGDT